MASRWRHITRTFTPLRIGIAAMITLLFSLIILGDQGLYQFQKLLEMKQRFVVKRDELNRRIDELDQERQLLAKPENLEMVIRSELGYIRPGEVLFEIQKPKAEQ